MWKNFPLFGINLHTDTSADTAKGGILRHLNDPNLQLATSVGFHFFPSLKRTTNSGWHYRKLGGSAMKLASFHPEMALFPLSVVLLGFPLACPVRWRGGVPICTPQRKPLCGLTQRKKPSFLNRKLKLTPIVPDFHFWMGTC